MSIIGAMKDKVKGTGAGNVHHKRDKGQKEEQTNHHQRIKGLNHLESDHNPKVYPPKLKRQSLVVPLGSITKIHTWLYPISFIIHPIFSPQGGMLPELGQYSIRVRDKHSFVTSL